MPEDQLYLLALGIAMRHYFDLHGEDPEAVHSLLQQANDSWTVNDVLDLEMSEASVIRQSFGRRQCSVALERIQTLVDDSMDTFRPHVK